MTYDGSVFGKSKRDRLVEQVESALRRLGVDPTTPVQKRASAQRLYDEVVSYVGRHSDEDGCLEKLLNNLEESLRCAAQTSATNISMWR